MMPPGRRLAHLETRVDDAEFYHVEILEPMFAQMLARIQSGASPLADLDATICVADRGD
jgi:hypothetical protein